MVATSRRSKAEGLDSLYLVERSSFIYDNVVTRDHIVKRELKVKLVDVVFVEDERLTKKNVVAFDFDRAERTSVEAGCAGFQVAIDKRFCGTNREVAKVFGFPKDDAVG